MKEISSSQPLWEAEVKTTDAEEFSTVYDVEHFRTFVLVVECSAITGTNITFDIYTNASGGANWEKLKDDAITITGASTKTYTIPETGVGKNLATKVRVSVTGSTLTTATFSAWLVQRVNL